VRISAEPANTPQLPWPLAAEREDQVFYECKDKATPIAAGSGSGYVKGTPINIAFNFGVEHSKDSDTTVKDQGLRTYPAHQQGSREKTDCSSHV
jgi:hypothetical protein